MSIGFWVRRVGQALCGVYKVDGIERELGKWTRQALAGIRDFSQEMLLARCMCVCARVCVCCYFLLTSSSRCGKVCVLG